MNKEEVIARPYEEYYEMIKDMSKDNMIQGLYDLSKECIEKENYINQLEKEVERLKEREKLVTEHYNVMVRHSGNLEGKIIQLEINRDEAIKYMKTLNNEIDYLIEDNIHSYDIRYEVCEKILEILEKGIGGNV